MRSWATEKTGAQDSKFCKKALLIRFWQMGQMVFDFKKPNLRKSKPVKDQAIEELSFIEQCLACKIPLNLQLACHLTLVYQSFRHFYPLDTFTLHLNLECLPSLNMQFFWGALVHFYTLLSLLGLAPSSCLYLRRWVLWGYNPIPASSTTHKPLESSNLSRSFPYFQNSIRCWYKVGIYWMYGEIIGVQ